MQRVDALDYRLRDGADTLLDRFEALGRRAAVVGAHGSGKTSLFAALEPRLAARGYRTASLRLTRGTRRLDATGEEWLRGAVGRGGERARGRTGAPVGDVVLLLDGADELSPLVRWRVLQASRRAAGLLVATHRRSWLPVLHRCRPDAGLLAELIEELHVGCRCALPPAAELFARHGGNLRLALRELYDLHASA